MNAASRSDHPPDRRRAPRRDRRRRPERVRRGRLCRHLDRIDRQARRRLAAVPVPAVRDEAGALPRGRPPRLRADPPRVPRGGPRGAPQDDQACTVLELMGHGLHGPARGPRPAAGPAPGLCGLWRRRRPDRSSARSSPSCIGRQATSRRLERGDPSLLRRGDAAQRRRPPSSSAGPRRPGPSAACSDERSTAAGGAA